MKGNRLLYERKAEVNTSYGRREDMEDMNVTLALLRAILELIDKAETLEELRASVKRIMGD